MGLNLLSLDGILWWTQLENKWETLLCDPLCKLLLILCEVHLTTEQKLWCCLWPGAVLSVFLLQPCKQQKGLHRIYIYTVGFSVTLNSLYSTWASSEAPRCVFWYGKHPSYSSQKQFCFCKLRTHGKCQNLRGKRERHCIFDRERLRGAEQ